MPFTISKLINCTITTRIDITSCRDKSSMVRSTRYSTPVIAPFNVFEQNWLISIPVGAARYNNRNRKKGQYHFVLSMYIQPSFFSTHSSSPTPSWPFSLHPQLYTSNKASSDLLRFELLFKELIDFFVNSRPGFYFRRWACLPGAISIRFPQV